MEHHPTTTRQPAYVRPQLRSLGSLGGLTMGMNGSCPDGNSLNNTQFGGMSNCGVSGGNM